MIKHCFKSLSFFIVFSGLFLALVGNASAGYELYGQGTVINSSIYGETYSDTYNIIKDTDNNLLWLDYTPLLNEWPYQDIWAGALQIQINTGSDELELWDNWRLPEIDEYDQGIVTSDLFLEVLTSWYWSKTLYGTLASEGNPPEPFYYYFNFETGTDGNEGYLRQPLYALAVTPVPVPAAFWLLGSGLIGLVGLRRELRK